MKSVLAWETGFHSGSTHPHRVVGFCCLPVAGRKRVGGPQWVVRGAHRPTRQRNDVRTGARPDLRRVASHLSDNLHSLGCSEIGNSSGRWFLSKMPTFRGSFNQEKRRKRCHEHANHLSRTEIYGLWNESSYLVVTWNGGLFKTSAMPHYPAPGSTKLSEIYRSEAWC